MNRDELLTLADFHERNGVRLARQVEQCGLGSDLRHSAASFAVAAALRALAARAGESPS